MTDWNLSKFIWKDDVCRHAGCVKVHEHINVDNVKEFIERLKGRSADNKAKADIIGKTRAYILFDEDFEGLAGEALI